MSPEMLQTISIIPDDNRSIAIHYPDGHLTIAIRCLDDRQTSHWQLLTILQT